MGIEFRLRDFAFPFATLRQQRQFARNQFLTPCELTELELRELRKTLSHAYSQVPYYRSLFDEHNVIHQDIRTRADVACVPFLTKNLLRANYDGLQARDWTRYRATPLCTSGTSGQSVTFLVDKTSNILEFNYYWRFWGWHGYRLGHRFAELSAESFVPIALNQDRLHRLKRLTNRLLINSLLFSSSNIGRYIAIFRKYRPRFLKGLPSNLYVFALLCSRIHDHSIKFQAIFAQGENLSKEQRSVISTVFSCPVYDSYGHMERTVAISQCEKERYHLHADYGFTEFVPPPDELNLPFKLGPTEAVYEVVSTSLHNLSMPLIRYRTGDLVVIDAEEQACPCKRSFPVISAIAGRNTDIVYTPEGRAITALYVALDGVAGVATAQVVQTCLDTLVIRLVPSGVADSTLHMRVVQAVEAFTGDSMKIQVHECTVEEFYSTGRGKFNSVVSHLGSTAAEDWAFPHLCP